MGIDFTATATPENGVKDGAALTGCSGAAEEPVLFTDGGEADGVFVRPSHRVIGDRKRDHTPGAGWEFLHIAIDDHARLAFAQLLPDQTVRSAIAFLAALGLKHRFTRPYTPKTNGKAQRFTQTSLREWAYSHSLQRSDRLPFFLHNYNWQRPHHSLKLKATISRLRLRTNNVLSLHS